MMEITEAIKRQKKINDKSLGPVGLPAMLYKSLQDILSQWSFFTVTSSLASCSAILDFLSTSHPGCCCQLLWQKGPDASLQAFTGNRT